MAATVARAESWTTSIDRAGWRALAASWLGWMFDGYETYAIVLVMAQAVGQLLPPEKLPTLSVYMGGLLAATLLGWAMGGVAAGVLTDYIGRKRMLMISILCMPFLQGSPRSPPTTGFCSSFGFLRGSDWAPNGDLGLLSSRNSGHLRFGDGPGVHFMPPSGSASSWHRVSGC